SFMPGESVSLPANEVMCIDFPEANEGNPTRCLAMQIDEQWMNNVILEMNNQFPKADDQLWGVDNENYMFTNDQAIHQLLQRLIFVFMEGHPSKDLFIQLMMKELIVRMKQNENREGLQQNLVSLSSSNRMAHVIKYIQEHLHQPLSVSFLAEKANMSEPNFHRVFRNEIGMSPVSFINQSRIKKATSMLSNGRMKAKEVFLACGFNNPSYFNRTFKKHHGISPMQYQRQQIHNTNM
ncbi:MAG: helix-turn-helix domain-containing protein, partial [Bacteroidota bacterium]